MFFYIFAEGRKNMHESVAIPKLLESLSKKRPSRFSRNGRIPGTIKKTGAVEAPV
jgi:hypothetical protein